MLHKRIDNYINDSGGRKNFIATSLDSTIKPFYSTSIPLACIGALVLLGICIINPITNSAGNSVYAADTSTQADDDGISLVISGDSVDGSTQASTSSTTYRSHTITASASNIESYVLSISYDAGSSSLKNSTAGATVISNVASTGVLGKNMVDNTWGWGWSDSTTTDSSNITYKPMLSSQSIIKSDNNPANNAVDFTGKLAFAAKFGSGATAGHYMANVVLSLAIEPKAVTEKGWNELVYMQDMNPTACSQAPLNTEKTLTDSRDESTYTIARIKNQTNDTALCWMTQNLRIINKSISAEDSDVTSSFTIPASNISGFTTSDQYQPKAYYANNTENGAYYNWYTATAGTGTSSVTSGNAPSSICPKGWRLPTGGDNGEYKQASPTDEAPWNFVIKGGFISSGILTSTGKESDTFYWSASSASDTNAYALYLYHSPSNTDSYPSYTNNRSYGSLIRCVAR